jgi:CheY-like chemotaxis protein
MALDVNKLKVLVVDDLALARKIVLKALEKLSITNVITVSNGYQACDALFGASDDGEPFDIVFLDWNLPELNGLQVLQRLRPLREFDRTAFVMFTATSEPANVQEAMDTGATGYLVKPVRLDTISAKLDDVLLWLEARRGV